MSLGSPPGCIEPPRVRRTVGLQRAWVRIRNKAGLDDVHIHDLRHTFGATGAGASQSLHILGSLLGHKQSRTTQVYAHLAQSPQKKAVDVINARLKRAMEQEPEQKVVPIHGGKK